jgi:hypothetical protein
MKRVLCCSALLVSAAIAAPSLRADVKTVQKDTFKLEGLLGSMLNRAAGGDKGLTTTVALKGSRLSRMGDATGEIIDLAEQKVYQIDVKKKQYTVMTFAEMRAEMEKAKADAAKRQTEASPEPKTEPGEPAKQYEFDVDVKRTGETKTLAGQQTHEAIQTITMREKGRKLEDGGGMVMTTTMWLAPRIAALDEIAAFNAKYYKAVYGDLFTGMNVQQMSALTTMFSGMGSLYGRMATETQKLDGTPIASTTVIESVKSAAQMANAPRGDSGGIGGFLARRMMRGQSEQRTTALTTTSETLSIAPAATAEDVAIPAGFKEKKK